jgi:hypothetical protein
MEGTPVPTREQDITQHAEYKSSPFEDDNRLEQTRAVTEHQDVTQESDFSRTQKPAQLPSQADAVTSRNWLIEGADDPDKNPFIKDPEDDDEENKDKKED